MRSCILSLTLLAACAHAQQEQPWRLVGDIGAGVNAAPTAARARSDGATAIPYLNFDYGPVFARIDTFGVKLAPAGAGSIELLTRVLADGYTPVQPGARHRDESLPLGLGTMQVTPVGAFMFNVYHDAGKSKGQLADLMYAADIPLGPVELYPQIGTEYRSQAYVRYYDGAAGYQPGPANSPFAALFAEIHVGGNWYVDANLRRSWLGKSVRLSPLVQRRTLDAGLVALSYRFN